MPTYTVRNIKTGEIVTMVDAPSRVSAKAAASQIVFSVAEATTADIVAFTKSEQEIVKFEPKKRVQPSVDPDQLSIPGTLDQD